VNVFQPSAVRNAASPTSDTIWPLQGSRNSRWRRAWNARPRAPASDIASTTQSYLLPVSLLRAVLFDVDFTIAKPGPDLGPDGYRRLGERFGLTLDPARYAEARAHAVTTLERHPELDHDEEVWVLFTEQIIRGMGGNSDRAYECAVEMTRAWEHAQNFDIFEDVLPTLAALRADELRIGLVSNTARDLDEFVRHHALDVDAAVSSGKHGKTKPHPAIFRAVLELLAVEPAEAVMVGDSVEDDVEGARAVGMRAILLDRDGRYPNIEEKLVDLRALPAALGLAPH
jgi:putative hydrolase of the HAD superfamily